MSAFNTVESLVACPSCGAARDFEVQFKFGDTWQHRYRIGDVVRWGGNNVGEPGHKEVLVEGIGGPCPTCCTEFLDFDVVIVDNRLAEVRPTTTPRAPGGAEGFIIVRK
jgi:hypothetical protein